MLVTMSDKLPGIELDAIDIRLLERLQQDAAESNLALAGHARVSPATCLRRVKRLVDSGVIERRVALLAAGRLGSRLTAIVEVSLDHQGDELQRQFEVRAAADAAVQQCYRVAPGPDFVLVVQVADMPGYQALVQRLFTADANVRNVKAFFCLNRAKFDPAIRLERPGDPAAARRA